MPHLRVRGMEKNQLIEISKPLIEKLSQEINCPKDYFTLEYVESIFILDGKENEGGYPFVDVKWFERDSETMYSAANIITNMIKKFGYEYVTVYFSNLTKEHYFENGERF